MKEWGMLIVIIDELQLSNEPDKVEWALEKSGKFSTASLYRNILHPGDRDWRVKMIWQSKVPMKVRIFLRQLYKDRIKSADQLKKKQWKGDEKCKMSGEEETVVHIFFNCPIAKFQWAVIREALRWDRIPRNLIDFF